MGNSILEIVLGAFIAILITIWIENLRKPKLSIRIASPADREYNDRPADKARFLYVEVANHPLPKWARWMSRNAATQCHATISFHHLDGQNVFGRTMAGRWSGTPEPATTRIQFEDKLFILTDLSRFAINSRVDIYPGEAEPIDIAVKLDDEIDCYGWSNDNYFSDPIWRNPIWKLASGRYLVKVVVTSAGEKISTVLRLINDVPRMDFRLEPKMPNDVTS